MKKNVEDALNGQMNAEFYSEYLYLSMAAYFRSKSLPGFAHWMECQAQEEHMHGMKFYAHISDRNGRALVSTMEGPPTDWESPLAVFEHALAHEKKVTGLINALVDLSMTEKDHATTNFLQWFVNEQVEEEASAGEVVEKLKPVGDSKDGLLMIDKELGTRAPLYVLSAPAGDGAESGGTN